MGKRSAVKSKTGKRELNPTDAYRKQQRNKEKKRNKRERQKVREEANLRKNPLLIKEDLTKLKQQEILGRLETKGKQRLEHLQVLWETVKIKLQVEQAARNVRFTGFGNSDLDIPEMTDGLDEAMLSKGNSNGYSDDSGGVGESDNYDGSSVSSSTDSDNDDESHNTKRRSSDNLDNKPITPDAVNRSVIANDTAATTLETSTWQPPLPSSLPPASSITSVLMGTPLPRGMINCSSPMAVMMGYVPNHGPQDPAAFPPLIQHPLHDRTSPNIPPPHYLQHHTYNFPVGVPTRPPYLPYGHQPPCIPFSRDLNCVEQESTAPLSSKELLDVEKLSSSGSMDDLTRPIVGLSNLQPGIPVCPPTIPQDKARRDEGRHESLSISDAGLETQQLEATAADPNPRNDKSPTSSSTQQTAIGLFVPTQLRVNTKALITTRRGVRPHCSISQVSANSTGTDRRSREPQIGVLPGTRSIGFSIGRQGSNTTKKPIGAASSTDQPTARDSTTHTKARTVEDMDKAFAAFLMEVNDGSNV